MLSRGTRSPVMPRLNKVLGGQIVMSDRIVQVVVFLATWLALKIVGHTSSNVRKDLQLRSWMSRAVKGNRQMKE